MDYTSTSSSSISSLLDSINELSKGSNLDSFELSNLSQDLQHILLRLQTHMYQESDYENRNIFDVPRRTEEFLRYLAGYDFQGEMWALLLKSLVSSKTEHILDLCPGWAPKIELALWKNDYKKTVYLLDSESASTDSIIRYMKMLKADLDISPLTGNFFAPPAMPSMDLVVANHIIDDLLLNEYCIETQKTLASLYASETELLTAVDSICQKDTHYQNEFAAQIATQLMALLGPSSYLILTQYAGLFEKAHHLDSWVKFVSVIFESVKNELRKKGLQDIQNEVISTLNPENQSFFQSKQLLVFRNKA